MSAILALDFGGSKHTAGLVDWPLEALDTASANLWRSHQVQLSFEGADRQVDIQSMLAMAHSLLRGETPLAIGVSFGGPVDARTNVVRLSHHVPGWENTPLGEILQTKFGCPVVMDNDANIAGLGEFRFGAGKGRQSLMYITISTGVGGGWVLDGKIWHGADGMAGEIGHMTIDPNGPVCLCGKRGCVERLASGRYLAADARELVMEARPSVRARSAVPGVGNGNKRYGKILLELAEGDLQNISGLLVSQAAALGDPLAEKLLQRAAWAIGTAIGNAANLMNPQTFLLGGGVTKSGEGFWESIRQAARRTALPEVNIQILPAALGDDAPLWGAVALAEICLLTHS
jgi:glucokinase